MDVMIVHTICHDYMKVIHYSAEQYNLERDLNLKLGKFSHITKKFPREWVNRLKSQYIIHKVFKAEGLIRKILNHAAIHRLKQEEITFLEFQAIHPWKLSFSIIKKIPADDFYVMKDVYREEEYLLYSPGLTKTRADQTIILWFNLIGFNGSCWQSYGPIGAYRSFEPDDIFFFATDR